MRVYFDCEFLEDGSTIALISIGMVRDSDGGEYYAVNRDMPVRRIRRHPWLMANVVPGAAYGNLGMPKRWLFDYGAACVKPRTQIAREVRDFITGAHPDELPHVELWADWGAYDHVALCQLWGRMIDLPEGIPMWTHDLRQEIERYGAAKEVPSMPGMVEHNALYDAREVKYRHEWLLAQAEAAQAAEAEQAKPRRRSSGRIPPPRSA